MIVDAYAQQLYIPWTMTTQEFWQDTERAIRSDGIVALNINATTSDAPLLLAVSNTIASVFDHVYIVPLTQDSSWNYLILASNRAVDLATLSDMDLASPLDEYADVLQSNVSEIFYKQDELVLTDDRAPVELMTEEMIIDFYFDN
ncbi:fused MFS/spermidine synthase [Candidatus Uhrbacteria bacterium]|nr:fused MFS/spermidine synthase [Candidatus Uhrbacteria bacterium]